MTAVLQSQPSLPLISSLWFYFILFFFSMIAFSNKYKAMVFLLNKKYVFLTFVLFEDPFDVQSESPETQ